MTTTPTYKKKLIEVAIPLEAINAASAKEKSIRHGHPSTMHLWWARRPLATCRAILFAQLVDDPSSHPDQFPTEEAIDAERKRLFAIIEKLVIWDNSTNQEVLEQARSEIRRSCGNRLPTVYDPFSGGASIPLEGQRLGLIARGSDLNPVAVMIGKAMIEIPPRFRDLKPVHPGAAGKLDYRNVEGLAEDVAHYGEWLREKTFKHIGHLYPPVNIPTAEGGGKATVIAWIWSRTVPSPDPAFSGVHVPITSNFALSTKKGGQAWVEPVVDKANKTIKYVIRKGTDSAALVRARLGTKAARGANFTCILSGTAITSDYVKEAGARGEIGRHLLAIVGEVGRSRRYFEADESHVVIADSVVSDFKPSQPLPKHPQYIGVNGYGFKTFGDLFTERQANFLNTVCVFAEELQAKVYDDAMQKGLPDDERPLRDGGNGPKAYSEAVAIYLSLALSRLSDSCNSLCRWSPDKTQLKNLFGRQAIPMVWDYMEANPFARAAGDFGVSVETVSKVLDRWSGSAPGFEEQKSAQSAQYDNSTVISTDPPYYDNIPYADISDFFYAWMKRSCEKVYPDLFSTISVPKMEELVADRVRHGSANAADQFFLDGMQQAITSMANTASNDFPAAIYYAFKQSEIDQDGLVSAGWATFLEAVLAGGFSVVATWPTRTEMANRMRAADSNALATSVVLVCRRREASAGVIGRAEFVRALKRELPAAISELQAANIAPADMPQSSIGPGMGVFSRYDAVLESNDKPMTVRAALQMINKELDEYLGGIQGEFDAETRFAITWFEQNGYSSGDYGVANSIAQARGISVESVKHAGIVQSAAGKVRIIPRDELAEDWNPQADRHLTIWECLQHLIRSHEAFGISEDTAVLLKKLSDKAEAVKDLAYCLYEISATKRKDAKEANAYNALIADWTELSRQAAAIHDTRGDRQTRLDF